MINIRRALQSYLYVNILKPSNKKFESVLNYEHDYLLLYMINNYKSLKEIFNVLSKMDERKISVKIFDCHFLEKPTCYHLLVPVS